ncbi:MAG: biotin/lipoyl-containing protein [Desulfitobacteriaceae bacterium]
MSKVKRFNIKVNGQDYEVEVQEVINGDKPKKAAPPITQAKRAPQSGSGNVTAPMPGVITSVKVNVGDEVSVEQAVVTLEAMKMENEIPAGKAGVIQEIHVSVGQSVSSGELLVVIG